MEKSRFGEFGLIIANSHPSLGLEIAKILEVEPLEIESTLFPNKELDVRRIGDASGMDICIFSSLHSNYNTIKELRLICDSVKGSAARVYGVFPFVKNGKSDHVKRHGETVGYKDTALEISSSGLEVIAIFDQHSSQHSSMYDTTHYQLRKVHHIFLMKILIEYAIEHSDMFDSVLALDSGGFKRNTKIAEMIKKDVSFILKYRESDTRIVNIEKSRIVGNVDGHNVISFDDMIQEASTIETGARIAKRNGAKSFSVCVVHNDFSENTFNRINPLLEEGLIDKVVILETVPLINKDKWHENMVILSPAQLIAEVIKRIHLEGHMRSLFLDL